MQQVIKQIAECTASNNHNQSVYLLAEFLKSTKKMEQIKAIQTIHDYLGHMPTELIKMRCTILIELFEAIDLIYGKETFEQFNNAF